MDVILGDIRKFVTDDVLTKNDVIGHAGHMQIFKNCKKINELVLRTPLSTLKRILCDQDKNYYFDEREFSRFNLYKSDRKTTISNYVADVRPASRELGLKYFNFTFRGEATVKHKKQCFWYSNGKLYSVFLTNIWHSQEILYVHFQKRMMKNLVLDDIKNFLCIPNRFVLCENIESIPKIYKFYISDFFKSLWKNRKSYLKHFLSRK